MRRVLVLALVLLVLNFFNACSIKPIYNNLDRLIVWQVGDYLDLNRDQKASLRTDLSVLLKWHRESHLTLYADWLAELPNQYSDGVSAQMIEDLFDQMLVWGEEIENQAMPLMTDVLVSLNEGQIDHLESEFRGANEEWVDVERGESLEDYQRGWSEEIEDAIERFTGRLNVFSPRRTDMFTSPTISNNSSRSFRTPGSLVYFSIMNVMTSSPIATTSERPIFSRTSGSK